MSGYTNRQEFELNTWPELRDKFQVLNNLVNNERRHCRRLRSLSISWCILFREDESSN